MNKHEMHEIFKLVIAGWPSQRQRIDDDDMAAMTSLYAAGLMDLDAGVVRKAIERVVRTAKFMPTVAEIREAAGVVVSGDQITGLTAWGEVVRAIGKHGAYKRPGSALDVEQGRADFAIENPLTLRVIRSLSWQALCSGTISTQTSDRARFADEYDTIASQERKNQQASSGFKDRHGMHAIDGDAPTPHRELVPNEPLALPSGEERSQMLHELMADARQNAPAMFADLANAVLKDRVVVLEEPLCACTQHHGVNPFGMCLYCRRTRAKAV